MGNSEHMKKSKKHISSRKKKKIKRILLNAGVASVFILIILMFALGGNNKGTGLATKNCPSCGKESSIVAVYCQFCGELMDQGPSVMDDIENLKFEDYIQLSSSEDVYALSRILSQQKTKRNVFGESYDINADFARFSFPEGVTDSVSKMDYLSKAPYILTNDIELAFSSAKDANFFLGIGSVDLPFKGIFNGNGKTVKLSAASTITLNNDTNDTFGLFSVAIGAKIVNTNVSVTSDIIVSQCSNALKYGVLAGFCDSTGISNCSITINGASVGVKFAENEKNIHSARVGAMVGECKYSTIEKSKVSFSNATLLATGHDVTAQKSTYAYFAVGGFIGFSDAGSDNTTDIGRIGNQLIECEFESNSTSKMNVLLASIAYGDEVDVGGLVGCSFNNFFAKKCTVNITNGSIVAEKSGATDSAKYGTNVGGLVGRLEHTGELVNCSVEGHYMSIVSKSPENYSTAGGLVGIDVGAYHRDCASLNNCSINGNGTSEIVMDIKADNSVNKWNAMGSLAGSKDYTAKDCTAKGLTLVNNSTGVEKCFVGGLFGIFGKKGGVWNSGTYFTPGVSEIKNCTSSVVFFDVADGVQTNNVCPLYE